jgi:hypothetical protein
VEKSIFQSREKRKKREQVGDGSEESSSEIDGDESGEEDEEIVLIAERRLNLRIKCESCRLEVADEYFDNLPVRKS